VIQESDPAAEYIPPVAVLVAVHAVDQTESCSQTSDMVPKPSHRALTNLLLYIEEHRGESAV
jgi:hypothetical protein